MRMLMSAPMKPSNFRTPPSPTLTLVASLLIKNPTSAAEQGAATLDSVEVDQHKETTAEPAPGARKRARRSRITEAVALDLLAFEIFVRLPAKDILRCRAVCRSWHRLISTTDFLLAHHLRQPLLPLLAVSDTARTVGVMERCRPIVRFGDHSGFKIHASCDGLLLLSPSDDVCGFSICNPATRLFAPFRGLPDDARINIVAMYMHSPSGEYRVLYWKEGNTNAHYILGVQRGCSPRLCAGVPSDSPGSIPSTDAPPVLFGDCLHWLPGYRGSDANIVVFDTLVESFSFMRGPVGAARLCARLCDMEGSMGFSCFEDDGMTVAKIWLLEDYEREGWSFKYRVKFPVESLSAFENTKHMVLSRNGDVLVYNYFEGYMFHCDNTGKLIEEFKCDRRSLSIIGHRLRESLVKPDFFPRRGSACARRPSLFHRL